MDDIRAHVRALLARREIAHQLDGRPDIELFAAHLVGEQDARLSGRPVRTGRIDFDASWPYADDLAATLVADSEVDPGNGDVGLSLPAGVRHALLHFSPILQLAAIATPDRRVGGKVVEPLPADIGSLVVWLSRSVGLERLSPWLPTFEPDDLEDADDAGSYATAVATAEAREAAWQRDDEIRTAFATRFRFTLDGYAAMLLSLRASDPVTYLLLISREYALARKRMPALGEGDRKLGAFLPDFPRAPLFAAMTVGELQRAYVMTRGLHRMGGGMGTDTVRRMVTGSDLSAAERGEEVSRAISAGTGGGRVFDEAALHTAGIRRLFRMRASHTMALDFDNVVIALLQGRIDWNNARSALTPGGGHHLMQAQLEAEIQQARVHGRGLGHHDEPLDLYCGVAAGVLPSLAVIELGQVINRSAHPRETELIAATMLANATGEPAIDAGARDYRRREALRYRSTYLPRPGKRGSAGRFTAPLWLDRYQDLELYLWLSQPVAIHHRGLSRTPMRRMFLLALWFLQTCFTRLYRQAGVSDLEAILFCDLATAVTLPTSDPILRSISMRSLVRMAAQNRAARPTAKDGRPMSNFRSRARSLDTIVDDALLRAGSNRRRSARTML